MALEAIDHVDLVVSLLSRSLPFYEGLLRPLGYVEVGDIVGERGERVVYLSRHQTDGSIGLRERLSADDPATQDRYALGLHHLAFSVVDRETVEKIAIWAGDAGAEIESGPREYDYTPGYYAAFVYDPDGIKLEFVHRPEEQDLVLRVAALEARLAELEGDHPGGSGGGGGSATEIPPKLQLKLAGPIASGFGHVFWWAFGLSILAMVPAAILAVKGDVPAAEGDPHAAPAG